MSLTIQTRPKVFVLAGNPVEFVISTNTVVISNHNIHVSISQNLGTAWKTLGEEVLPVINNSAKFDVSDYLKRKIKLSLNIFNLFSKTINRLNFHDLYYLSFYETYNNDGIIHNQLSITYLFAFQGGFSTIFLNNYINNGKDFYTNFFSADKKFMTWGPDKKLTLFQHDILFFLSDNNGAAANIRAKYTLTFSDNSTNIIYSETTPLIYRDVYYFCPSILAQEFDSLETPTKKLVSYNVFIEDTDLKIYTETKTYYVDRNSYTNGRHFIFKNSLGAFDIMYLKGVSSNSNEIQRTIGFFQTKDDISYSEFKETFEAASGFIVNSYKSVAEAQRYIVELFNSNEIYEIIGKEIIPVIPTNNKVLIKKDNEFLFSFTFDYEYAYSDQFFAPFDTEQYLNPRIFYRNGIVTPEPVNAGAVATLNFDVVINENSTVDFEINWGADVGITSLLAEVLVDDVPKSLQSQITVPGNVSGFRTIIISDSKGGKYYIDYNIGSLSLLFETSEPILFESGEQFLTESI